MIYRFWDVGEEWKTKPPTLSVASTSKMLTALILCDGRLYASHVSEDGTVVYRIGLPIGKELDFEDFTGYMLTPVEKISGM